MTKSNFWNILGLSAIMILSCHIPSAGAGIMCGDNHGVNISQKQKHIKSTDPISISTPAGTCPRLPYQVWVTYSDGTHEWRQVTWSNYARSIEEDESSVALTPAGSVYEVVGYIIGDNTTDKGFPIKAAVNVTDKDWEVPSGRFTAHPLPLGDVTITGNNRLTSNRQLDIEAILSWDVNQQLYNYRDTYCLSTEGYPESDGWDSPTTKLKGHGVGHYLSALAFAYASTSDKDIKARLMANIRIMVNQMRECQEMTFVWNDSLGRYWEARDYAPEQELKEMKGTWEAFSEYRKDYKKYGYGYINAIPAAHPALIECYRAYNNEEWVWAPYYTIHKQLAGLIDIALNVDDREVAAKALLIAKDMGLWVWNRMHYRTYVNSSGSKAERQARPGNRYEMWNMYIAGEVGGIAESLARLSEMVTDKTEKAHLLEASNCFDAPAFFDPLTRNIDDIRCRHANQHIPMITGALRSYLGNNNPAYYNLAYNFWNMIQGRYSYAMGGVGNGEMWRQPYSQMLSMNTSIMSDHERNMYPNPDINETCCAYNLAKLTKDLNCFDPDNAAYMDYYERLLYNQIVGSVHPEHYGVTYQYAVGMNAIKPFGSPNPQSTCCGGTGAENHVKYQEAAYFVSDNTIWVALYMPTDAYWREKDIHLIQSCQWPAEKSTITFDNAKGSKFAVKLRVPYWATSGFDVRINGKSVDKAYSPCSYVEIPERIWTNKDKVEIIMPFSAHICWGPDKMTLAATGKNETRTHFAPQWLGAIMYGPLVMTTPDISDWNDANFTINSNMSNIELLGSTGGEGTNGNVYSLRLEGKTFTPDYYQTGHSTHYLRLNMLSDIKKKVSKNIDKATLQQVISLARERKDEQEAWNALNCKVPVHAPWAQNGYSRMLKQLIEAESIEANTSKTLAQQQIDDAASNLNMAINSMRPGNLAEPEDLTPLLSILSDRKNMPNKSAELREAIDYAEMVVQYVNDGSGTIDMIFKAIKQLEEISK